MYCCTNLFEWATGGSTTYLGVQWKYPFRFKCCARLTNKALKQLIANIFVEIAIPFATIFEHNGVENRCLIERLGPLPYIPHSLRLLPDRDLRDLWIRGEINTIKCEIWSRRLRRWDDLVKRKGVRPYFWESVLFWWFEFIFAWCEYDLYLQFNIRNFFCRRESIR